MVVLFENYADPDGNPAREFLSLNDAEEYESLFERIEDVDYYAYDVIMELRCLLDE